VLTNTFHSLIAFTDKEPKDFMVPSRWGTVSPSIKKAISTESPIKSFTSQIDKRDDPYAPQQQGGCCTVM